MTAADVDLGMTLSRRRFLSAAAFAGAGVAATSGAVTWADDHASAAATLPAPGASGIDHIVVVMMENRSFDHFLGWLPGADGRQAGSDLHRPLRRPARDVPPDRSSPAAASTTRTTRYEGGRIEFNGGKCDGWLKAGAQRRAVDQLLHPARPGLPRRRGAGLDDLRPLLRGDRWPRPTRTASTSTRRRPTACTTRTAISTPADDLGPARRRRRAARRYYFSDVPFTRALGDEVPLDRAARSRSSSSTPPPASCPRCRFVDPRFEDEASGTSGDDHPHADIRAGEKFLNQVYTAVTDQPELGQHACWSSTTTSGAASSTTSRRPTRPTSRRADGTARLPRAGPGHLAARPARLRRPQRLRPHLDPAGDRVALEPRAADPSRRACHATSPSALDFTVAAEAVGAAASPCRRSSRQPACPRTASCLGARAASGPRSRQLALRHGWSLPS